MDTNSDVIVNTRCGQLRGAIERSFEDYEYCAFKGIPYAKPPIGELRFKDPVPIERWAGIKNAKNFGPMCCQSDYLSPGKNIQGSEDCLYLNVYVKSAKNDQRLPVMVWIHGGAFMYGSGDDLQYGPDYLLRKNVVLVTLNYRLGIFGFLNLEDEVAPGNQGLKDQILALKWVQTNIENFGGDPNNVTLFGESAGAAAVHYLTLSDLTKGLFHKAIIQSSVAYNTWAYASSKKNALKVCQSLGNNSTDPKELIQFLRTIDCDTLVREQEKKDKEFKMTLLLSFGPGVDDKSKEPVMPIHPAEAIERGVHVPLIIGCNDREGMYFLTGKKKSYYEELDRNFERYLPEGTKIMLKKSNTTPKQLREFYFGDEKISDKNTSSYVDFQSDIQFVRGIHRVLKYQVRQGSKPTYFYYFTYDKGPSLTKLLANTTLSGAAHFDEVAYLFSMRIYDFINFERPKRGTPSYKIMEQMTEMWTNFAMCGNPTPITSDLIPVNWHPVKNEKVFQAMNIDDELKMDDIISLEVLTTIGAKVVNKNKL